MELWKHIESKLNKSGRKWSPSLNVMPYRYAELFCEKCGKSLGVHDIATTNLETIMYCTKCSSEYIKSTPINLSCGNIVNDWGYMVLFEYQYSDDSFMRVDKICYFNKKGRYIKVKGKRYYL